ncbi:hypothetical protein PTKIN_Ptkin11bG0148500 [Pterospermum kingtungense]
MGRKIVREKSLYEPGKRCRLWEERDVYHVLTKHTATEVVEGMVIDNKREKSKTFTLSSDAFLMMKKLRLLRVLCLPSSHDLKYISNELRLFEWHGYPLKFLPSSFKPDNLVALLLPNSCIEQLWNDNRPLYKLKILNLEGSQNLMKTPDFEMIPNIESLNFESCTKIVDLHPSIAFLRSLKLLNLRNCKRLRSLPTKIGMGSLQKLILRGCSNLKRFPEIDGEMKCLVELYLNGTGIEELPSSIGHLSNLVLLNLKDCKNLASLPSSVHGLKCLKFLNLSGCSKIENLPENLKQAEFLEELDLSETAVRKPHSFIFQFKNLKVLSFKGCKGPPSNLLANLLSLFKVIRRGSIDSIALTLPHLSGLSSLTRLNLSYCNLQEGAIPNDICCLSSLETLDLSGNNFMSMPATITCLSRLRFLQLSDCKQLKALPGLLTNIETLILDGCTSFDIFTNPSTESSIYYPTMFALSKNHGVLNNALTLIKRLLKIFHNKKSSYGVIIPGDEIPELHSTWDESSIKITLPANIRNDSQWLGVGMCFVFVSSFNDDNDACEEEAIVYKAVIHSRNSRQADTDEENQECTEIELTIGLVSAKVKKCGVTMVYEKDLELLELVTNSISADNFGDISQDTTLDHGSIVGNGSILKRKYNTFYEEEEEEKEGGSQPKRLQKFLKLITGKKH